MNKWTDAEKQELEAASAILKSGKTLLYPTDTVWGLGCDATNGAAVEKIFAIKQRAESKSLILLVDGLDMLQRYVDTIPDIAFELIEHSERPLTIVYPGACALPDNVFNKEDGSVAIRICSEPFCRSLIRGLRKPIVSTSANISGETAPSVFASIDPKIVSSVDHVVNYRRNDNRSFPPSSIIKLSVKGEIQIIRK